MFTCWMLAVCAAGLSSYPSRRSFMGPTATDKALPSCCPGLGSFMEDLVALGAASGVVFCLLGLLDILYFVIDRLANSREQA